MEPVRAFFSRIKDKLAQVMLVVGTTLTGKEIRNGNKVAENIQITPILRYTNSMSSSLVLDINAKLEAARVAYYAGTPILTDAEFDFLEAQLSALIGKHPELASNATALTSVGTTTPTGARIKHVRPMLSIENQYTKDDVVAFFNKLQKLD